jgi:hypothetical protein
MLSNFFRALMIAPSKATCQIEDVAHLLQNLQRNQPMGSPPPSP